ncbi:hypothetical protein C8J57DRAFT_1726755 [Mycena rebaudengoi]|nr:hypothetical protein C8J57DRAFT_1726755 [Mycena rebaudengoi]
MSTSSLLCTSQLTTELGILPSENDCRIESYVSASFRPSPPESLPDLPPSPEQHALSSASTPGRGGRRAGPCEDDVNPYSDLSVSNNSSPNGHPLYHDPHAPNANANPRPRTTPAAPSTIITTRRPFGSSGLPKLAQTPVMPRAATPAGSPPRRIRGVGARARRVRALAAPPRARAARDQMRPTDPGLLRRGADEDSGGVGEKLVDVRRELELPRGLCASMCWAWMRRMWLYVDLVEDALWIWIERSLADMVGLMEEGLGLQEPRIIVLLTSDVGATVWALAEARPPSSDTEPPVSEPALYSPAFHEFSRLCSEPVEGRAEPGALLETPFIQRARGEPAIIQLLPIEQALRPNLRHDVQRRPVHFIKFLAALYTLPSSFNLRRGSSFNVRPSTTFKSDPQNVLFKTSAPQALGQEPRDALAQEPDPSLWAGLINL